MVMMTLLSAMPMSGRSVHSFGYYFIALQQLVLIGISRRTSNKERSNGTAGVIINIMRDATKSVQKHL
jgi:hypothetical protein